MATAGLLTCILKLMVSGLPEKMSVTMVLTAIRRLQQRDCPGFSPDSLFNHYAQTMPAAAGSGSKPIALAKVQ